MTICNYVNCGCSIEELTELDIDDIVVLAVMRNIYLHNMAEYYRIAIANGVLTAAAIMFGENPK